MWSVIIDSQAIYCKKGAFYCFFEASQNKSGTKNQFFVKSALASKHSEKVKTVCKSVIKLWRKSKVSLNISLFWLV